MNAEDIIKMQTDVANCLNSAAKEQLEKVEQKINSLAGKPMPVRKRMLNAISNDIESIQEALKTGPLFETLRIGSYYRRLISLASSETENMDEMSNISGGQTIFKFILRQIVERMAKENLFDGFPEDKDIFNNQFAGSTDLFATYFFDKPLSMLAEYTRKPWMKDKISVGLFGHTNAGKTRVLNALFDEKFPVNQGENTAIPTFLYKGDDCDYISLVDSRDGIQRIPASEVSIIDWDKSFHFPFHRMYDYIAKQNQSEVLSKFTFVDAPGVFSGTSSNHIAANQSIETADVVVWVTDIKQSIGNEEVEYLETHAKGKPVYVVSTFTALMTDDEYNRAEQVLIDRMNESNIDFEGIIRFNSDFPNSFKDTFNTCILERILSEGKITPATPEATLLSGIYILKTVLDANMSHYTDRCVQAVNEREKLENKLSEQQRGFVSRINAVIDSQSNLIDEYKDSILLSAMRSPINRMTDDINRMIEYYGNMNIPQLSMQIAQYAIIEAEAEEKKTIIQELQDNLDNIIKSIS